MYLTAQGRVTATSLSNATTYFEIVQNVKNGTIGWNNTLLGEFIYSPRDKKAVCDHFRFRGPSPVFPILAICIVPLAVCCLYSQTCHSY